MPEDQSCAGQLLNGKKVQLLAQHAVVPALRLFQPGEVLVHLLAGKKCRAVNALQLGIVFVTQPISAGEAQYFEGLDPAGRGHVRPAAKIFKGAIAVERNLFAGLGEAFDEVGLHKVVAGFEARQTLVARLPFANEGLIARDHFAPSWLRWPLGLPG